MIVKDLATVLSDDHLVLERICTELELDHGSPENRKAMADHLIARLVQHLVAEEPYAPSKEHLVEVDRLMRRLADTGPQETRFETLLSGLVNAIHRHVNEIGPAAVGRARSSHSSTRLRELGKAVLARRTTAPSVPHPTMSDRTPAKLLLRRGPGFVDRARAAVTQPSRA